MLKRMLLLLVAMAPGLSFADPAYVSEDIFIYLHSGPSRDYRIIGSVNAGTPLEALESSNDFTKVREADGREGWVENQYLTKTPSFRVTIPKLETQLKDAQAKIETLSSGSESLASSLDNLKQDKAQLTQQVSEQQAQIDKLQAEVKGMDQSNLMRWFLYGGGVAGGGLLLGLLLPRLIPSKKRKNMWV
ncbi:TIGR04211 family SH3 domain-containing protein [Gallaecimonas kandeliae]|uniref:TIGR04211 family SH3 domain-containing protein n=1 Tax=Gallaecimonas kandeliae TaxID=3029055 RepID=UPI0026483100|nr:TIGR04211 family SH3 domain-containing protein [Gallaecimonas kandeliae]WKE64757.1 TIGR04211 family SH3 domain-containing protein [Gallaecimonas kandeliae]